MAAGWLALAAAGVCVAVTGWQYSSWLASAGVTGGFGSGLAAKMAAAAWLAAYGWLVMAAWRRNGSCRLKKYRVWPAS